MRVMRIVLKTDSSIGIHQHGSPTFSGILAHFYQHDLYQLQGWANFVDFCQQSDARVFPEAMVFTGRTQGINACSGLP